jgi:glycosyltransferase involved in cell wall biosynthesis
MAQLAVELLSDDRKQREMGARGRDWAVERFNTETVIPQYEQVYERITEWAKKGKWTNQTIGHRWEWEF